jgi:hypothetical protein
MLARDLGMVVGAALASFAAGCGGGGGGSGGAGEPVDFGALHAQYTSPTGKLRAGDVISVANAFAKDQQTATPPLTAMSARAGLKLDGTGQPMCSGAGGGNVSCSCPGGGSFSETGVSSQGGVVEATVDYQACVFTQSGGETLTLNGSVSFADYAQQNPTMLIYSGTVEETITPPGTTDSITMNFAMINGVITYDVSLSDGGNVLVQDSGSWDASTDTGSFTVIDSSGTWTCNITNGAGSCSGPNGQTLTVG